MRHPIYPIDLHLDAEISSPRIRQEGTHTRRYWYLGLALRNLFPSIGTAIKAMDKKKKLYQVGGGGGSGSSAVTLGPRFPYASLVQPGPLRTTSAPLPLSIANRFSLSPSFPSLSIQCTQTRCYACGSTTRTFRTRQKRLVLPNTWPGTRNVASSIRQLRNAGI